MRKIGLLLAIMLLISVLSGCGSSSTDILEQYKDYTVADSAANKAGLSIGKIELIGDNYVINVFVSHLAINQSEENAGVIANRLRAVNAQNLDADLDFQLACVNSSITRADGTRTQEFYPAIRISKDAKAKYVVISFEGISKDEAPELETPPMFFIVELDKKEPKALTEKPLLADDLFK